MWKLVCVVASVFSELKMENCIVLEKKKVRVTGELPAEKMYLKPLYNFINQPKPVKIEKIIEEYNYSFSDRKLRGAYWRSRYLFRRDGTCKHYRIWYK